MIYTSSYDNCKSNLFKKYSISGDRGKKKSYDGECYPKLAPAKEFWKEWHENIGKKSEEENIKFYIREYWLQRLSKLDVNEVYKELNRSILLCYEKPDEFCHREIVAAWFELFLIGVRVPEVKTEDLSLVEVKRNERYKMIKDYLEEVIRETIDMKGFASLKAYNLYEQSEQLKILSEELKQKNKETSNKYLKESNNRLSDANIVEEEYKEYMKKRT